MYVFYDVIKFHAVTLIYIEQFCVLSSFNLASPEAQLLYLLSYTKYCHALLPQTKFTGSVHLKELGNTFLYKNGE